MDYYLQKIKTTLHASEQQILIQKANEKGSLCVRKGSYTIPDSN